MIEDDEEGEKGWEREDVSDVQGREWDFEQTLLVVTTFLLMAAEHFGVCNHELMLHLVLFNIWQSTKEYGVYMGYIYVGISVCW